MEKVRKHKVPHLTRQVSKRGPLSSSPPQARPEVVSKFKCFGYRDHESDGIVQTLSNN